MRGLEVRYASRMAETLHAHVVVWLLFVAASLLRGLPSVGVQQKHGGNTRLRVHMHLRVEHVIDTSPLYLPSVLSLRQKIT